MKELDLEAMRKEINQLDEEFVRIFEKRMNIVLQVAEYKDSKKMPVLDRDRELKVIARAVESLKDKKYTESLRIVVEKLMEVSRQLQVDVLAEHIKEREQTGDPIRVGYQGVNGSYSHQALTSYFNGIPKVELNYTQFEDVILAVKNGEIRYGVLPIENSSTGGINEVYDLIRQYDCHIVGEKCVRVEHNLLALPGADIEKIKKVFSHPQGFEQSREFFKNYPQMELVPYFNTAHSAKMVSEGKDLEVAAVASAQAAKLYGLDILASNINYSNTNHTRFIVIANEVEERPDADKITIVIAVKHEAGSLYNALGVLNSCGLNMLNIESRPIQGKSWEYFFHIDLDGNMQDQAIKDALKILASHCAYCKVLGNYVADKD